MKKILLILVTFVIVIAVYSQASASLIFYNESSFIDYVGDGLSFESFESLEANNYRELGTVSTSDFSIIDDTALLGIFDSAQGSHDATDGEKYILWDDDPIPSPNSIQFEFDFCINAFALTLSSPLNIQDPNWDATLSLSTNGGDLFPDFLQSKLPDGYTQFIGIITDTPFTELSLIHSGCPSKDTIGFDEVHYGDSTPIPEPGTMLLLGTGLFGLAILRKKTRK